METREIVLAALALTALKDNPALAPDPRNILTFAALRKTDPIDILKATIDQKSEITVGGKSGVALTAIEAEKNRIRANFGSGRKYAKDNGGSIGKFFTRLREKIAAVNAVAYRNDNLYAAEWQLALHYETTIREVAYQYNYIYKDGYLHQPTKQILKEIGATWCPTDDEKLEVYRYQEKLYAFRLISQQNRWVWDRDYHPSLP